MVSGSLDFPPPSDLPGFFPSYAVFSILSFRLCCFCHWGFPISERIPGNLPKKLSFFPLLGVHAGFFVRFLFFSFLRMEFPFSPIDKNDSSRFYPSMVPILRVDGRHGSPLMSLPFRG